ncbi:MAG: hypothetical protein ABL977_01575, partial [Candidatus Eisenbacteria bacterium]
LLMWTFVRATLVASLLLLRPALALADPVAVLAALEGRVTLTPARARTAKPATFGSPLERGDRISVAANGKATLLFNDGNVIELGAGSSMTLGGRAAAGTVAGNERLPREAFASVTNFRVSGSRERGLVAAPTLRTGGTAATPEPLEPRSSDLLTDRPQFRWRAVPGAVRYSVRLSNDHGEQWAQDSEQIELAFPASATALADGEYLWEVQAYGRQGPLERASATFRVLPAIEAEAVRSVLGRIQASAGGENTAAGRYLGGAYLFERGMLNAAAEQFSALTRLAPGSPAPHEALGDVYRAVGLKDLADDAYEKARSLSTSH